MVKVVMVTMNKEPVTFEFSDINAACGVMKAMSDAVVGGCAFTVSFPKEEPASSMEKSRFIEP